MEKGFLVASPRSPASEPPSFRLQRPTLPAPQNRVHPTSIRRIQKPFAEPQAREPILEPSSLDFELSGVSQRSFWCAAHPAVLASISFPPRGRAHTHSH